MNSFESVIKLLLERQGYWVQSNFKVELTKAEKRKIGKPTLPRVDLDALAYKPKKNLVCVVECKSYLDSPGVRLSDFTDGTGKMVDRYKLFTNNKYRSAVFSRLQKQLKETGMCRRSPRIALCLAAGRIASKKERSALREHFHRQHWILWDDEWIREELKKSASSSYEDQVPTIVAKLLTR